MNYIPPKIIILQSVYDKISNCILENENLYEVGGVFLGHYQLQMCYIVDVTVPVAQELKSKISFVLDGEKETNMIQRIISMYNLPPEPIGIWHSHVNGSRNFSIQDKESNYIFARLTGGAISAVAIPSFDSKLEELVVYYVSPCKKDILCAVEIKDSKYIPKKYLINAENI